MAPSHTPTSSSDDENRARVEQILRESTLEELYAAQNAEDDYGRRREPDAWAVLFGVLILAVLGAGVMAAVGLARLANSEPMRVVLETC